MKMIVCLEARNGILFLGRRLSWDSVVCGRILEDTQGAKLWMNAYSASAFGTNDRICVAEDYLNRAGEQDYCFAETGEVEAVLPVQELTVYWWNRRYPSDTIFPLQRVLEGMRLQSRMDFAGSSHDNITQEIYCR